MNIPPAQIPPKKIPVRPAHQPFSLSYPYFGAANHRHPLRDLSNSNSPTSFEKRTSTSPKTLPCSYGQRTNYISPLSKPTLHCSSVSGEDDSHSFSCISGTHSLGLPRLPDRPQSLGESSKNSPLRSLSRSPQGDTSYRLRSFNDASCSGLPPRIPKRSKSDSAYAIIEASENNASAAVRERYLGVPRWVTPLDPHAVEDPDRTDGMVSSIRVTEPYRVADPCERTNFAIPAVQSIRKPGPVRRPRHSRSAALSKGDIGHQGRLWLRTGHFGFRKWHRTHGYIGSTGLGDVLFLLDVDDNDKLVHQKSKTIPLALASARMGENKLKQGGFSYRFRLLTPKRQYMLGVEHAEERNDWLDAFSKVAL